MPRPEPAEIQSDSELRVLDPRSVFVHNDHLQGGVKKTRSCGMCANGLGSAYAPVKEAKPVDKENGVPESDGADEEKDATHSRDFRDYTPSADDQLLG